MSKCLCHGGGMPIVIVKSLHFTIQYPHTHANTYTLTYAASTKSFNYMNTYVIVTHIAISINLISELNDVSAVLTPTQAH